MANVFKRFVKGILLAGETTVPSDNKNGSIFYHSSDSRIKTYVEDAVRELVTNSQNQNLTNKTIIVSSNNITTAASGNLSSTELNAALSELQSDIDTRATQAALTAHINDFSGAHDAAAISFDKLPYTITSNDVQGAIGETWVTLQGHIADSSDAHDASAISVIPSGTLASTDVQAALQELQTDVDSRVTTASNVGTGSGVFKQKNGSTLELKSLSAGSNITITEVGDSIQLSAAGAVINDATTSSKGIVKLAGDLAGTADLPTVPALSSKAPLASPSFTGTPLAPTAPAGTNTTQIATTAFVQTAVAAGGGGGGGGNITTQLAEFAASNWTARTATEANGWTSIAHGNISGFNYFAAVALTGTNRIMTSPDGVTWTAIAAPAQNNWMSITSGNNMFVAVASTGTNRVMKSEDAITWTSVSSPSFLWNSITFGNGLFVAVSTDGRVMTSNDGATWTLRTAPINNWRSVTFGNGVFVAVSNDGGNWVMYSSDGINWTAINTTVGGFIPLPYFVTFGNGLFVAIGSGSANKLLTSPDGINWTSRTPASTNTWMSIAYGNGIFTAVSMNGINQKRVMTSSDGITWIERTAAEANAWSSIAYGSGLFVAVSNSGTNRIMTSLRSL